MVATEAAVEVAGRLEEVASAEAAVGAEALAMVKVALQVEWQEVMGAQADLVELVALRAVKVEMDELVAVRVV